MTKLDEFFISFYNDYNAYSFGDNPWVVRFK